MKKGHIYISGPITGRSELNLPQFRSAEEKIKSFGMKPVVPHDLVEGLDTEAFKWEDYMRICIKAMMDCEAVITLDDWEESPGACIEVQLARSLNMDVYHIVHLERIVQNAERTVEENQEA